MLLYFLLIGFLRCFSNKLFISIFLNLKLAPLLFLLLASNQDPGEVLKYWRVNGGCRRVFQVRIEESSDFFFFAECWAQSTDT